MCCLAIDSRVAVAQRLGLRTQLQRQSSQCHHNERNACEQRRVSKKTRNSEAKTSNSYYFSNLRWQWGPRSRAQPRQNHAMGQLNNSSCISVGQRVGPISTRRVQIPCERWRKPLPVRTNVGMCGKAAEGSNVHCMVWEGIDDAD